MKRRGFTFVGLLVFILVGAAFLAGPAVATCGQENSGWFLLPAGLLVGLILLAALKGVWDTRISLPRLMGRLDRLDRNEGDIEPGILRLKSLWVSIEALEESLLPRLDVEGRCRRAYLEILGKSAGWRPRIEERIRQLSEEPDPLAPLAREILSGCSNRSARP